MGIGEFVLNYYPFHVRDVGNILGSLCPANAATTINDDGARVAWGSEGAGLVGKWQ